MTATLLLSQKVAGPFKQRAIRDPVPPKGILAAIADETKFNGMQQFDRGGVRRMFLLAANIPGAGLDSACPPPVNNPKAPQYHGADAFLTFWYRTTETIM